MSLHNKPVTVSNVGVHPRSPRRPVIVLSLFLSAAAASWFWLEKAPSPGTDAAPTPPLQATVQSELPKPVRQVVAPDRALPPNQAGLWAQPVPEAPLAEFQRWANAYAALSPAGKTDAEAQGVALATTRREAMKLLIRVDPSRALDRAVPESVRKVLPMSVTALLEERVDGDGDLRVTAAGAPVKNPPRGSQVVTHTATLSDGREFEAYVYGLREDQPTRMNIPMHGIAIGNRLALSEWPGRVLEPMEVDLVRAGLTGEPVCPTSGQASSSRGDETAIQVGSQVDVYCGKEHARDRLAQSASTEALRPPGFGVRPAPQVVAASGGAGEAVPNFLGSGNSAWTTGNKNIGIVRVKFLGTAYQNLSEGDCEDVISGIDSAFNDWSYGRINIRSVGANGSFVTPVLNLPHSAGYYDADNDDGQTDDSVSSIWTLAGIWAMANGRPFWTYDYLIVIAGDAPIKDDQGDVVWWGGLGRVGEGLSFLRSKTVESAIRVGLHEVGHNLGLAHSSNLYTTPQLIDTFLGIPIYETFSEYGDRYCRMGRGAEDFNVRYKQWLHWLEDPSFPLATTDGRYTLREHDLEEESGVRGLQVPFNVPGAVLSYEDSLSIEYRLQDPTNPLLAKGAQIRLLKPNSPKVYLLDATPETPNHEPNDDIDGNLDSPLLPGRTFSFTKYGQKVHITSISADPDSGKLVVQINHGTPSGNHAPNGSILFWTPSGAVGQKVFFTADVSDADGDEIAYHWQIPGAGILDNSPTVGCTFNSTGTKTIKCIVSDMQGGVRTITANFQIVNNKPPTISAISDQIMKEDTVLANVPFVVNDPTSDPSSLVVTATSDNTSLFPAGSITLGSVGGGNRRITLDPGQNKHGVATITVQVSDGVLKSTEQFKVTVQGVTPGTSLFVSGATWRYWDADAAPPADWKSPSFADSSWKLDNSKFIYNQGLLIPAGVTVLAAPAKSRTTCYFRKSFFLPVSASGTLTLRLLCDDGAVVHIDGVEVWRQNMPVGKVGHTTRAASSVEGVDESAWTIIPLDYSQVRPGAFHTLAIEVHDSGSLSRGILLGGDVSFDCELAMLQAPTVSVITDKVSPEDTVAGPYSFSAAEAETPPGTLQLSAESSNPSLVRDEDIKFGFNFLTLQRTISMTPRPNASGVTEITLKVSDGGSETWRRFKLTVTPVDDPPTIKPLQPVTVALGEIPPMIEIQVDDVDTPAGSLTVTAGSANAAVVPVSGLQILPGNTPNRRWLRITPAPGVAGQSLILVRVSDGSPPVGVLFTFRVSTPLPIASKDVALIKSGDLWRYWVDPLPVVPRVGIVDFTDPDLDDRAWRTGYSQLGYGDGDEVGLVPVTPYRVTTYFRKSFNVANPADFSALRLRLLRDDGAVVYLNGTAIATSNMPRTYDDATPAVTDITGIAEDAWISSTESTANLRVGRNVLAVEIHQSVKPTIGAPGDLSFDLELDAVPVAPLNGEDVLIPPGDVWTYWDQAQYPDVSWRLGSHVTDDWNVGFARLGYGVGGESTLVNDDNASGAARNASVLFRRVFDVADPGVYRALHLLLQRDDGAAVYLNGNRVLLDNLDSLAGLGNWSLSETPSADRLKWRHYLIDRTKLVAGRNLLAVEVHQSSGSDTDLAFDLQLTGELSSDSPKLFIQKTGDTYELSWSAAYNNWSLRASGLLQGGNWAAVPESQVVDAGWIYVQTPGTPNDRFFRLINP